MPSRDYRKQVFLPFFHFPLLRADNDPLLLIFTARPPPLANVQSCTAQTQGTSPLTTFTQTRGVSPPFSSPSLINPSLKATFNPVHQNRAFPWPEYLFATFLEVHLQNFFLGSQFYYIPLLEKVCATCSPCLFPL